MLKVARGDGLKKVVSYRYNGKTHYESGRLPYYEVYIDHKARQFITYNSINLRWLQSKLDRLSWPDKYHSSSTWISSADARTIAEYLGAAKGGYSAILDYQLEIRKEARIRHHKKETDPWDADVALTPALPKDWNRWVDKVGIPQNYIFYEYKSMVPSMATAAIVKRMFLFTMFHGTTRKASAHAAATKSSTRQLGDWAGILIRMKSACT